MKPRRTSACCPMRSSKRRSRPAVDAAARRRHLCSPAHARGNQRRPTSTAASSPAFTHGVADTRMGPAPTGATAALRPALCTPSQGDGDGSGVGGLGVRAQDPFALAARARNLGGFDEAMLELSWCLRASVGRRTHARTARPRADAGGEPSPTGRNPSHIVDAGRVERGVMEQSS